VKTKSLLQENLASMTPDEKRQTFGAAFNGISALNRVRTGWAVNVREDEVLAQALRVLESVINRTEV